VDAMDVLPYNEEDDQGGNGPTWAGVGLGRRFWLGCRGPVGPFFFFSSLFFSEFFSSSFCHRISVKRKDGGRDRLRKISKQVSNIFQKLDLLPPKQFQRFATLLFYVYFIIRKGEGDFFNKIIRAK
jgi:hypothetical protein